MFKASIDQAKLERSLKRFAKDFGETNAQAVCRWGVQVCRELAVETQAWGKSPGTWLTGEKGQLNAIRADAHNVCLVAESMRATGKGFRCTSKEGRIYYASHADVLNSPQEVNDWIEINRTRRRARTARLHPKDCKVVKRTVFEKALKARFARAGMAKGGWLGAGQDMAKHQTGAQRITIGKNFISRAQKHSGFGKADAPRNGFFAVGYLHNRASHVASRHVLRSSAIDKSMVWGLRKTLSWYRAAMKRVDRNKI